MTIAAQRLLLHHTILPRRTLLYILPLLFASLCIIIIICHRVACIATNLSHMNKAELGVAAKTALRQTEIASRPYHLARPSGRQQGDRGQRTFTRTSRINSLLFGYPLVGHWPNPR